MKTHTKKFNINDPIKCFCQNKELINKSWKEISRIPYLRMTRDFGSNENMVLCFTQGKITRVKNSVILNPSSKYIFDNILLLHCTNINLFFFRPAQYHGNTYLHLYPCPPYLLEVFVEIGYSLCFWLRYLRTCRIHSIIWVFLRYGDSK